jgi:hypothetical protein
MRILSFAFLFIAFSAGAQPKPVIYTQQSWVGYYPQLKFSKHWGIWFDSEIHTNDHYFNGFSQATFRLAGTYYNDKLNKFTAGYGYTNYFPGDDHAYISIPEHFAWQQYQWFAFTNKRKLMQWIRLEEKWKRDVADDHTAANTSTFTYKARYNIYCQLPLNKKGLIPHSLALAMGDELYLYYGPHTENHLFDQNRVFIGLSYSVNSHDNLVLGIMNMLQEDLSHQFKDNNVLRLSFFQNIGQMKRSE